MTGSNLSAVRAVSSALEGHTTLYGRWRLAGLLAWFVLVALVLVLWSLGTSALIREPFPDCGEVTCDPIDFNSGDVELARDLGLPSGFMSGPLWAVLGVIPSGLFFLVSGVIFWRRSYDWMGLLVSFALIFIGGVLFSSANDAVARTYPQLDPAMGIAFLSGFVSLLALFFLFPDGRFVPTWARWVAPMFLVVVIGSALLEGQSGAINAIRPIVALIAVGTGLYSQVYRYRRMSGPIQRQQTKWVVIGLMAAVALGLVWSVIAVVFPPEEPRESRVYALLVAEPVVVLLLVVLPLSFAISILRYRLWDIDVLVNRALVYGVLTGTLVGTYIGIVVGLQAAFRAVTDQGGEVAIVISTLTIAALFQPLRRRIQALIDRRFYRRRYDAAQALAAFSATIRDEVNLERLSDALMSVVEETMEPAHVSLWLRRVSGSTGQVSSENPRPSNVMPSRRRP